MEQNEALNITTERLEKMQKCKLPTPIENFYKWEEKRADEVFLRQPIGDTWKTYTWAEVGQQVRRMASALRAMNLPPKSNIAMISKNCAHWVMADLAIIMSGHVSVPFFPTLTAEQLSGVLQHSESKVIFVGKLESDDIWKDMKEGIPTDMKVIKFPQYTHSAKIDNSNFLEWDDLTEKHEPLKEDYLPKQEDLVTICYTSGTTSTPKGVMITNYAFAQVASLFSEFLSSVEGNNHFFSYLPLNHIAERAVVELGALDSGGSISFAENLDSFAKNLQDTQPTVFLAVPRIWKKFQQGILSKTSQKKLDLFLKIPILSGIVKNKIKKGLGLSKAIFILSGAAPIPPSLVSWFQRLGIEIKEGYGMSENVAACTVNREGNTKIGTVGQAHKDCEIKIDEQTGEILMKSEWLMEGYYKAPEKTSEVLKDGWLHTGDKGTFDSEGFLKIIGRVKEIFKTAKGEYVSPFTIESKFAMNPYIEQICVVGIYIPQPVVLIILNEEGKSTDRTVVENALKNNFKEANAKSTPYEKLQTVVVLENEEWSVDNGIITPTLKTKRGKVDDVYSKHYEKWYDAEGDVFWEKETTLS